MKLVEFTPWVAATAVLSWMVMTAINWLPRSQAWRLPATLSALFLAWSVLAIVSEGPIGFWTEHTRNMWGNQIWFDLLLAVGMAWHLIAPQAKSVGMRLIPWLLFIACTGSIGLLAMLARVLYLQETRPQSRTA